MVAVSSLGFSVYEQYTSSTNADGTTSQSGSLQAGVTVGTDDGSEHGSAIILDVTKAPASQKLKAGLRAVDTLTQVANQARTQAPKEAAAGRLARAIEELRALNLSGGGLRAVQQAVRIAQDIASAVRELAQAEQAIAEESGSTAGADDADIGAAEAAAAGATGIPTGDPGAASPPTPATSTDAVQTGTGAATDQAAADRSTKTIPGLVEAGYSREVGAAVSGLVAAAAGLGAGPAADGKATSVLAQAIIAQLQASGLPVDGTSLTKALQELIANPLAGAEALQASAAQAGLNVAVATSLEVKNTLTDPRSAAAQGISAGAAAAAIDDPYDQLIKDAVAALAAIGKGLRKALPPLLNSDDKKTVREARKAQEQYAKAVADTVTSIGDYYTAKGEVEAEGGSERAPDAETKAAIDAADAVVNGPNPDNHEGGTVGAGSGTGDAGTGTGTGTIAPGSSASTSIGIRVSVDIQA